MLDKNELQKAYDSIGPFSPRPDDDVVICRCEEVTRGEIRKAVHMGLFTFLEIKRYLRTGMGLCQGQTCTKLVRGLIAQELGLPLSALSTVTARAPMRPLALEVYARDTYDIRCLDGEEFVAEGGGHGNP